MECAPPAPHNESDPIVLSEEAQTWCVRRAADVLVTDIRLPGKADGWQIAERSREHHPELPVVYAIDVSPVSPRPVPGSLMLQKLFLPSRSWMRFGR